MKLSDKTRLGLRALGIVSTIGLLLMMVVAVVVLLLTKTLKI